MPHAFTQATYDPPSVPPSLGIKEEQVEYGFIGKLQGLKYEYRPDIRDRAALERNFREKFEALNRVHLSEGEFARLLDEIVTPDVYTAARTLRERNAFTRDDGTPLNYTLVNIRDWCKNSFEVVNQLRINTDYSHHRYDVLILINGVPCMQIELKTLGISPRRAMEQVVDYKNHPGNGYTTEDGRSQIKLRADQQTVWLTQLDMAELFDATKQNISLHLKNIFPDGALDPSAVVKESLTTPADAQVEAELNAQEDTLGKRWNA